MSIGDELTLGQKLDTNSKWISERLVEQGVVVREHTTLADDLDQNIEAFRRLCAAHPLVISTGGLGPTADDLTRQALAAAMGEELVEDAAALAQLRDFMARRGRDLSDLQRTQAQRPRSALMLENPGGTAPGIRGRVGSCDVFCLPGPPREMQPMFEREVLSSLRLPAGRTVRTRAMHCLGLGEGDLAARLGAMMERGRNPLVGTTASGGVVSIRIRFEGNAAQADGAMQATEAACRAAAGEFCFGNDSETIESVVLDLLRARGGRLLVAESCTGGGLGELVTSVPGASDVFLGGWIAYSNSFKSDFADVPGQLIAAHGAVSEQVARTLAEGARRRGGESAYALAITGIAGPGGGSDQKPVGTVFVSAAGPGFVEVRRFQITGDRFDVRDRASKLSLAMLRWRLIGADVPRCLWQIGARA